MGKILLVDDEPEIAFLTKVLLEKEGYDVVTARNGAEGMNLLEREHPDLILLDIMMPGIDGWEICKMIKDDETTTDIPVVMFTVRTSEDSMEKSYVYSRADAQINKPFRVEEFLDVVKGFVNN